MMELGAKGIKELEQQKKAKEAAIRAASQRKPIDPREALIDQLILEVGGVHVGVSMDDVGAHCVHADGCRLPGCHVWSRA